LPLATVQIRKFCLSSTEINRSYTKIKVLYMEVQCSLPLILYRCKIFVSLPIGGIYCEGLEKSSMWRPIRHKMCVNYQEADASSLYRTKISKKNFLMRFGYLQRALVFTAVPNLKYLINWAYCCLRSPVFG